LLNIPVVPHKAVAEVSKIGPQLLDVVWCGAVVVVVVGAVVV
jgi:hypothetical protein